MVRYVLALGGFLVVVPMAFVGYGLVTASGEDGEESHSLGDRAIAFVTMEDLPPIASHMPPAPEGWTVKIAEPADISLMRDDKVTGDERKKWRADEKAATADGGATVTAHTYQIGNRVVILRHTAVRADAEDQVAAQSVQAELTAAADAARTGRVVLTQDGVAYHRVEPEYAGTGQLTAFPAADIRIDVITTATRDEVASVVAGFGESDRRTAGAAAE